jgi:hypothetical protein
MPKTPVRGIRRAVARFFLGFFTATTIFSLLALVLYVQGLVTFGKPEPVAAAELTAIEGPDDDEPDPKKRKRPRAGKGARRERSGETAASEGAALPRGEATTGDDLNWDGERRLDMAAGEAQLSGKQIEAGFDSAMSKIRRCLVLVPAEGEVTGKLTFGMRVGSDGQPRAVNLSGPAVVTSGESGSCLRQAAQAIRFAKFEGPDMLFRYPVTLQ